MKKFLLAIICSLLLIGCDNTTDGFNSEVGIMCVRKVNFEGHRYLVFSTSLAKESHMIKITNVFVNK